MKISQAMYSMSVSSTYSSLVPYTKGQKLENKSALNTSRDFLTLSGGIINAVGKLFVKGSVAFGQTEEGLIYVETFLHDSTEDKLLVLYDHDAKSLMSTIYNIPSGALRQFDENRTPYEYLIPYMIFQYFTVADMPQHWEKVYQEIRNNGKLEKNPDIEIIMDAQYYGGKDDFDIETENVEELRYIPDVKNITETVTGEYVPFDAVLEENEKGTGGTVSSATVSQTGQVSHLEEMQDLQAEMFPLVKDFYESLSEEDKALVPTEKDIAKYIPTEVFRNIVRIVQDGLTVHDMNSQNVLLKGAPGVGKSKMCVALAYVFSMPYRFTQGYKSMDASEYRGSTIANNGVLHTNTDTPFVATAKRGGIFVDEDNNYSNEGENTVKNSMLIEPYSMVLADQTIVKRHPFSIFAMTANPDMKGARPINEAYKDRFCTIVDLDALSDKEMIQMVMEDSGLTEQDTVERMVECWHLINKKIIDEGEDADLLTPRTLQYWARQTRVLKDPVTAAKYNVLGALCASETFKSDIYRTVIMPRFKRRR